VDRLLVTANVPSYRILVTLKKEALSSSETSALTSATHRNIPEDVILHSHLRENLKSYMYLFPSSGGEREASNLLDFLELTLITGLGTQKSVNFLPLT
jgi:hypothetical protein